MMPARCSSTGSVELSTVDAAVSQSRTSALVAAGTLEMTLARITMLPRTTPALNAMIVHHCQPLTARQPSAPASPGKVAAGGSALPPRPPHKTGFAEVSTAAMIASAAAISAKARVPSASANAVG
jgi:hypothetical protein